MAAPTVVSRASSVSPTTDATTLNATIPSGATGHAILGVAASDGAPVLSTASDGWTKLLQGSNTTVVTGGVYLKRVASASEALAIAADSAQQFSAILICVDVDEFFDVALTTANGSSTNSNPPSLGLYASLEALLIAARAGDSTVVATVAPSGYSNLQSRAAGGTSGASTNTAERTATVSSEDPGTFTSATEQWVAFTVAIWNDTRSRLSAGDRAASLTLSNSNLTATSGTILDPGGYGDAVRATKGRTTGKYGFSFRRTSAGGNYFGVGLSNANSSRFVSQNAGANELHLYWDPGGAIHDLWNGDAILSTADFDQNEWNVLLVDLDAGLAWLYDPESGLYNGDPLANPDTGVGGIDISGIALNGGLHPTLNFGASSVAGEYDGSTLNSAPNATSFSVWDASGAASLVMPLISSGAASYSPALAPQAVSAVLPLIGSTAAIFAPALALPPVSVALPLIGTSAALYAPSVAPQSVSLALPPLGSSAALYGPTLSAQPVPLSLPLIAVAGTTYSPTMALTLQPPLLASTAAAFAPALSPGAVLIATPLLASTANLYAPALAAQGATIVLPSLAAGGALHAPALAPQAISAALPLIASGATLFAPSVGVAPLTVSLPLLAGSATLHQPALAPQPVALAAPLIASTAAVHAPALSPQAATVAVPAIGSAAVLHPPLLASQATAILLPNIVSAAIFYPPVLSAELVIDIIHRVTGRASGGQVVGRPGVGELVGSANRGAATGSASGRQVIGRATPGEL